MKFALLIGGIFVLLGSVANLKKGRGGKTTRDGCLGIIFALLLIAAAGGAMLTEQGVDLSDDGGEVESYSPAKGETSEIEAQPHPNQVASTPSELKIKREIIRIGEADEYGFDFKSYATTVMKDGEHQRYDRFTEGLEIKVPFKKNLEVAIVFDPLDLQEPGIIKSPGNFEVLNEHGSWTPLLLGSIRSYKIEEDRAIAFCSPWVNVPYGEGGTTMLKLTLWTKNGERLEKTWKIRVGRNPAVYKNEF